MNDYDSYVYAQQRVALARLMNDAAEVKTWQQHVVYLQSRLTLHQPDALSASTATMKALPARRVKPVS